MGSFFDKQRKIGERAGSAGEKEKIHTGSALGREITSVENAKSGLFFSPEWKDPSPFIDKAIEGGNTFYGFLHAREKGEPIFIQEGGVTHEIFIGSTGTGKGVLIGNKVTEAIRLRRGVIIVDPKKDSFLPQVCKEELERQGRGGDLQIASWPGNFGYSGINDFDTYRDVANKFFDALDLSPSDNPAVDYYRKNSRVLLVKVLKIFFEGRLGVTVKKDFDEILTHLRFLKEDMEKQELLEKEQSKMRPNYNLIQSYEIRFFDQKKIDAIYWDTTTIETLDSLVKSISEIAEGAVIFKKYDLRGALYEGKVLYLKVDMLDPASLNMVKMMLADAIIQARFKKANTTIIADELSFYANDTIAAALATVRSMGLKFILALQDLSQMREDHVRNAVLSNCNVKFFYKISDKETLEYVEKIGGEETVTAFSLNHEGESRIQQKTEPLLNATRIRALPRQGVGILIAEELNAPVFVSTHFVKVSKEFDWQTVEITNLPPTPSPELPRRSPALDENQLPATSDADEEI